MSGLAGTLPFSRERGGYMLGSLRKSVAIRPLPVDAMIGVGTLAGFLVLLAHDQIPPLMIYLLQVYLTF